MRNVDSGYILGKCIHLDTDDPMDTDFRATILNHLDLAINIYTGDSIKSRREQILADGMVQDADYRTHLFRIENIPFPAVIAFVTMYFDSSVLIRDWLEDQFGKSQQHIVPGMDGLKNPCGPLAGTG